MRVNGRSQRRGEGCIELRHKEGLLRNEAWRKLTPAQQLKHLDTQGFTATRQRAKLEASLGSHV